MDRQLVGAVLFGADEEVSEWVSSQIPEFRVDENTTALGIIKDGELIAGVVYERFNGVHVEVAIAAIDKEWATRATLRTIFSYPFDQLGCKAISVLVPSTNIVSLNLATKLGFEPEAFIKYSAHDGSTLIVLKLFKENCIWIGNRQNGQGTSSTDTT